MANLHLLANLTPFSLQIAVQNEEATAKAAALIVDSSVRPSIYGPRVVHQPQLENVAHAEAEIQIEEAVHGTSVGADAPGAFPVGTEISKVFGDGIAYRGQVVSFHPEHKLYAVKYDDGDSEELTEEEVQAASIDTGAIEMRPGEEESGCGVNQSGAVQHNGQAAGRKARKSRKRHESDGPAAAVFASFQDPHVQAASRVAAQAAANAKSQVAASVAAEATAAAAAEAAARVRKTPSWPRSWANFSPL